MLLSARIRVLLTMIGLLSCSVYSASAQSTVFNTPSTDVVARGRFYLEADFMAHLSSYESGGYQLYGSRALYGASRHTEVGLNAFYVRTESTGPVVLQPNFKWKFFYDESKGVAAAAGMVLSVPVTHRASTTTHGMIYGVASKNVKGSFGPRLTAGGYGLVGAFADGTTRQGVLLGYEQPLIKHVTFITDWSSGNNDLGYLAAGVGISVSRRSALYLGYNTGNHGRGNNSIGIFYGFNF